MTPNPFPQIILVTGPARSGKSEWAESLAQQITKPVIYVATAQIDPSDLEWFRRIEQHRHRRPEDWKTLEVPYDLVSLLTDSTPPQCLLIDSLGTWVANLLDQDEPTWNHTMRDLMLALQQVQVDVIFVAEETGWGIIPAYPSGRLFRDRLGSLVRQVGLIAHVVYLVTGGYVLNLSELGQRLEPH